MAPKGVGAHNATSANSSATTTSALSRTTQGQVDADPWLRRRAIQDGGLGDIPRGVTGRPRSPRGEFVAGQTALDATGGTTGGAAIGGGAGEFG